MSYSSLYLVYKTRSVGYNEYRNGYGTGPMIWGYLTKAYGAPDWLFGNADSLWKLARDPKVPDHLRLCHALTFDRAVVPVDKLLEMADALDLAHKDIISGKSTWSHFADIAADMRAIHKKHHRCLVGVALNCTSVADVWHSRMTAEKGWDCYDHATNLKEA